MLQSIRDRTHGWIAGIIISLVILSFALWGIHSYLEGAGSSDTVAKVNGVEISKRQLAAAYEPLRNRVQITTNSSVLPESVELGLKRRALDELINVQVLKQASISGRYRISELQVETYLERMPDFQVDGHFSLARFKQLLANNSLSVGQFFDLIQTTLLIDQPKAGIVLTSFALPYEVDNAISLINQERDIAYIALPRSAFVKDVATISESDIATYYKENQDQFKTPEQVNIDYVVLSAKKIAEEIHPTDAELKNYYSENIGNYTEAAQLKLDAILIPVAEKTTEVEINAALKKAAEIKEKLRQGADFATLAHQYPAKDVNSDWVALRQLSPDLQKPIAALKKDEVSEPLKTAKGLMLIKVVDTKPAKELPFELVKPKVSESLVHQLSQEKFAEQKEKLASLAYEHPESLDTAAKELNLSMQTSQMFTKDKAATGDIATDKKIRDLAFTNEILVSQNNSDVLQLTPDTVIVLRVKTHVPAAVQSLESVRADVVARLKEDKANKQAETVALQIKSKLTDGVAFDSIPTEFHVTWNKAGYLGRDTKKIDSALLYAAFSLPRASSTTKPIYTIVKTPEGYAVLAILSVRDGATTSLDTKQREMFTDQVQNAEGLLEYKLYQQSLAQHAKIKLLGDFQAS